MAVKASATITLSAVTDIESVWWYYKLQSSTLNPPAKPTTNPPPSGWTDAEPAYTPGSTNTLYFVELTVFSDGTFDYGSVSVSSSYEAAKAAWNKAQAVDERVSVAETAIEQTQQAIQLRATKTEVQTVATAASNAQSAADAAQSAAAGAQGTANAAQSAASAAQTAADNAASAAQTAQGAADAAQSTADAAQSAADSAQEGADFATPLTGAEPPEEAPAAGKLWIDEGQVPSVWRRWRGADVTTEREYTETIVGRGKNLLKPSGDATVSGVTYTLQDNGTYLANGTVVGTGLLIMYKGVLPPGQYTISGGAGGIQVSLSVHKSDGAYIRMICASHNGASATGTVTELTGEEAYHQAFIQAVSAMVGQTVTNVVLSPQLEAGDTATAFEAYEDVPLLALDNAQGQIESMAVEAGCRAKQAGTGEPSPENIRAITGRESVEIVACGKNIADVVSPYQVATEPPASVISTITPGSIEMSANAAINNAWVAWRIWWPVKPGMNYTISAKIECDDDSFTPPLYVCSKTGISGTAWPRTTLRANGSVTVNTNDNDFIGLYLHFTEDVGTTGARTVRYYDIQIEEGSEATAYEPYRALGGGTITPSAPLYGLPGAEDTVEMSVDGDVTVTRRTAVVELDGTEAISMHQVQGYNRFIISEAVPGIIPVTGANLNMVCSHYAVTSAPITDNAKNNAMAGYLNRTSIYVRDDAQASVDEYKSWLAAQKVAGTPVTIVYELAAPETEALTAISPIAPQPGQLNLFTDADALTATIHGSGWETVNDTNDIRTALADVDSNVAGLIASMGLLEGTVAQIGEQIITPEGIVSIVAESDGYQALVNMASQSADGLELVRVTVSNLNGRVETLEEGVHVEGSNVGLYSSGSPFRMDIDHTGIGITENGQPTITVRESRADIPRIMTETLIIGGFAYRAGENDLYQMIV